MERIRMKGDEGGMAKDGEGEQKVKGERIKIDF